MDKMAKLVREHRKLLVLVLFLAIAFLGFSVSSALRVSELRAEQAREGQRGQEQAEDGDPEDAAQDGLTEEQRALAGSYDQRTARLVEALGSGVWSADGGRRTLRFGETTYIETVDGAEEAHTYAISAVEYGTNGSDTEIDTIVFVTDTGTHIATYSLVKSAESENAGQASLESSTMFSLGEGAYGRVDEIARIEISGIDGEAAAMLGDMDRLADEMSAWCSVHYPAATSAAWGGNVTIDYANGIVVTSFSLGTADAEPSAPARSPMSVSVTYHREDGTYEFGL